MSRTYQLTRVLKIPASLDNTWNFFSNPRNLPLITPAKLGLKIISGQQDGKMYPGQLIEYTVRPLLGIPLYWMTEITHVEDKKFFVDEQRFGPYSLWHHQHHFKEMDGFVEMTDIVHYKLPLWFLGDIAHGLFVRKQIASIFDYRESQVTDIFGRV